MRHRNGNSVPPPRRLKPSQPFRPTPLWQTLPQSCRDRTLLTLARVLAQQLQSPSAGKEGDHEHP